MAHAFTYLMNAVFVLMTTNYTLNPGHYFLGGAQTSGSTVFAYFPAVQIALITVYASLKVYISD